MFSGDRKIASFYSESVYLKKLIHNLVSDDIDILSIVYSNGHLCCRSCTCKMICHYNMTERFWSLYKILNAGVGELHHHDLRYKINYVDKGNVNDSQSFISDVRFDKDVFWVFYDFIDILLEYSRFISIDDVFEIFNKEVTRKTVQVLKANCGRLNGKFGDIVRFMENRNVHEHVLFCDLLKTYLTDGVRNSCEIKSIINYCINKMEIREVAAIYEQLKYLE